MIRLLVAEDQTLLREALVEILEREAELEVVSQCARLADLAGALAATDPDVALIDIEFPDGSALDALPKLVAEQPSTRWLVLTVFARPGYMRRATAAGAAGFVLKDAAPPALVAAIQAVAAGQTVVDPDLAAAALRRGESPLTPRETQVLAASRTAADTQELAETFHLSAGSVRNVLSTAIHKLGARSRRDAARKAEELGWL